MKSLKEFIEQKTSKWITENCWDIPTTERMVYASKCGQFIGSEAAKKAIELFMSKAREKAHDNTKPKGHGATMDVYILPFLSLEDLEEIAREVTE
jgi:hypothetical protein